jgi:photosystem II stability/assembly factor-like uncharacterized protein
MLSRRVVRWCLLVVPALAAVLLIVPDLLGPRFQRTLEQRAERLLGKERRSEPPWEAREEGERGGLLASMIGRGEKLEEGKAWDYFEYWYGIRAYPQELIPQAAYFSAWQKAKTEIRPAVSDKARSWASIGPDNIGGRVLSMAIDPSDPQVIWAGSASGGLWKSTTGGEGADAWSRVETGFPSLSVSAIVLDPSNPQVMYLGTGELGRYQQPKIGTPGARASYGIGIIKSLDGGLSWQETGLTWTFDQRRAVLSLRFDPLNHLALWAATSEGLYKTVDGGDNWTLAHAVLMAMDVVIDPDDPQRIYVAHGQLNSSPNPGIYRSTNGGTSWVKLSGGLPTTDFGRCPLAITRTVSGPSIVYAGVSDAITRATVGLFRSTDGGDTWANIAPVNWAGSQAWYDNVVGVSHLDPNLVLCGGLDWYRSTQAGTGLARVTYWHHGDMGVIPPGGEEGSADYVHADQHAVAFHPTDSQIIYVGSDGGIFKSSDGGQTWSGKNGGFVTTQFYAGFAGGYASSGLAVGGLQDNGTIKYTGSRSWSKIFGGDGGWCAIDPRDEAVIYEEYVYLNMYKSIDGGDSWQEIHPKVTNEANFIAPYVVSESRPDILYAGTRGVKRSIDGGQTWQYPDGNSNWNGTPMAIIGVSFTSPDTLLAATGSGTTSAVVQVKRSTTGGTSWTDVTAGLPDRYPTDFAFCRQDSRQVWLTFSGYGASHVFRSNDAGLTWTDRSGNLPDIPVQCVVVDPRHSDWAYVGTDLGVFMTTDGGAVWLDFNQGMPTALVLDLIVHPAAGRMRAATFGNGVYEVDLPEAASSVEGGEAGGSSGGPGAGGADRGQLPVLSGLAASPNPFRTTTALRLDLSREASVTTEIFDGQGRRIRVLAGGRYPAGVSNLSWDGRGDGGARLAAGTYFVRAAVGTAERTVRVVLLP